MDDARKAASSGKWTASEAKAHLGEVIERAQAGEPQLITRNGRKAVFVVDADAWEKRGKPKQTLYEFLRASPLVGVELDLDRDKSPPRDIEL